MLTLVLVDVAGDHVVLPSGRCHHRLGSRRYGGSGGGVVDITGVVAFVFRRRQLLILMFMRVLLVRVAGSPLQSRSQSTMKERGRQGTMGEGVGGRAADT